MNAAGATAGRDGRITTPDVLRRTRLAKSAGTLVIDDPLELGWGDEHRRLVAKLFDLSKDETRLPLDLTVQFRCDQLYVHGLGLLAAWCDRYAVKVRLDSLSTRAAHYLEATGFKEVVEEAVTIDSARYDAKNHVALTRVLREEQDAADAVAKRLTDLFTKHITLNMDQRRALTTTFAELVENVYRHASSNFPAYVMAQAFPTREKLHVVIADTGIGVYQSFRQSKSDEVRDKVRSELDAVNLALEKRVTSKTERHSGYGLFVVRRLVQLNGGVMRLMSGGTTKRFWHAQQRFRAARPMEAPIGHRPWKGTEVSVMFNLDKPLPLLKVYEELGPVTDQEDFFD